jgi:hypothetical protein
MIGRSAPHHGQGRGRHAVVQQALASVALLAGPTVPCCFNAFGCRDST